MVCYCDQCRLQSGSPFSTIVIVPRTAVAIAGDFVTFDDIGTSAKLVTCGFCPRCGAPLITDCEALPDNMIIKAGTIRDNDWFSPPIEILVRCRLPWIEAVPEAVQFDGNPPLATTPAASLLAVRIGNLRADLEMQRWNSSKPKRATLTAVPVRPLDACADPIWAICQIPISYQA